MIKKTITEERYIRVHDRLMCVMIRSIRAKNSKRLYQYGHKLYLLRKKYRARFARRQAS